MANLGLKQLDPILTGSLRVSGSSDVTGSLSVDTDIIVGNRVTSDYGRINYTLIVNEAGHGGGDFRVESADNAYQIFSDANQNKVGIGTNSLTSLLTVSGDVTATHVTASGNISGSSTSTGSFGKVEATTLKGGRLELESPLWPADYIDVAFDGTLFIVSAGDVVFQPGGGELIVNGNVVPDTDSADDLGSTSKYWRNAYIDSVTTAGNVSGSSISTGSFGYLNVEGDTVIGGNLTLGDADTDSVTIAADLTSNLIPDADVTYDIGSTSKKWRDGFMASLVVSSSASASTAITANNIQNGYPTSNAWGTSLEGSYFNNFDNTTHVSEILRFMSGVLSSSLDVADAAPNTKTFASVDTNENSLGTADSIGGYLPQDYTSLSNATLNYLVSKDWTSVGSKVFNTLSVYHDNGPTYYVDFDSNSGGSTSISSSNDTELFNLGVLSSGAAADLKVRVHATHSFSDSGSISAPDESSNTFTTQSRLDLTLSSFGTSNGLNINKLVTTQPAVIPSAYQDGKFTNVGGTTLSGSLNRKHHATNANWSSVSASGWYRFHGLVVGIATGSSTTYQEVNGTTKNNFWAPIDQIDSDIGANTINDSGFAQKDLTCVSRSLSGAPYVTGSTYELSTKITGLFNPMYTASPTLVDFTAVSVGMGSVTITNDTVSTNGGTIQTGTAVYDSTGATERDTDTVPYYNDIAIVSASVVWDADNDENINQTSLGDTSFQTRTYIRNRDNTQSNVKTQTIKYHAQNTFGQHNDSGSMALYGRDQGYDGGSLTGTSEAFTGEDFRIQLTNDVLAFNGTAWVTTFAINQLGNYDLQVKPGYLVEPGGDYGYWYPEDYGSGTYKYYIRRFQTSGTKTSMTVDVGKTLVNWNASTADSAAVAILYKSSASGSGQNSALSTARIFDPSDLGSSVIETGVTADNFKNPFTDNLDLYGNTGGSLASTEYTVPMRNVDGMYLDNNDNEFYVIVRYKGDITPVTSITIST